MTNTDYSAMSTDDLILKREELTQSQQIYPSTISKNAYAPHINAIQSELDKRARLTTRGILPQISPNWPGQEYGTERVPPNEIMDRITGRK